MTVTRSIKIPCHDLWHFDCHVQILILLSNDLQAVSRARSFGLRHWDLMLYEKNNPPIRS